LDIPSIARFVEALLFVADGPVSLDDLAKALDADREAVERAIQQMNQAAPQRGLHIIGVGARVQLATIHEAAPVIERFLGVSHSGKLSPAALETLAVIAYRQPITRAQVDAIRGVNSDGVVRTLLAKSLIAAVGRLEQAGRPVLYGTTFEFLQYMGIRSLDELPPLPDFRDPAAPKN